MVLLGVAGSCDTDDWDATGWDNGCGTDDDNDEVTADDAVAVVDVTVVVVRVWLSVSGLGTLSCLFSLLPCCSAHSCKPAVSSCHPKLGH